jgi:hypothetical protein
MFPPRNCLPFINLITKENSSKTSFLRTLDLIVACSSIVLLITSSLLIANGSCSSPHGFSADTPLCEGQSLSIQSWLAILGVQFTLLGTVVLPRAGSILTSKYITKRVAGSNGLSLATLLNSQTQAPLKTQLRHGLRRVILVRILIVTIVTALTILYTFSFVRVTATGILDIPKASWTELGESSSSENPFSNNLQDRIADNTLSSRYVKETKDIYDPRHLVIGPSLNISSASPLLNGTVRLCYPLHYTRNEISFVVDSTTLPAIKDTPYKNGLRIFSRGQEFIDIYGSSGNLSILLGESLTRPISYLSKITATVKVCTGHVLWKNDRGYQEFEIQDPQDIACIPEAFDFDSWNQSDPAILAVGIIQGLVSRTSYIGDQSILGNAISVILTTLDHSDALEEVDKFGNPLDPWGYHDYPSSRCKHLVHDEYLESPAVAEGQILSFGTGMTMVGIVLQALVLFISLCVLLVQAWPVLPLISEWPAQWIALVQDLDYTTLQHETSCTSSGRGEVTGETRVFLSSANVDGGQLRLSRATT